MMIRQAFLLFSIVVLASAANSSFRVDLYQPTVVNGTTFKPGEAKVELKDNKVVIKQGKTSVEADVKVEANKNKYQYTTVGYRDGERQVKDISIGGTTTHIVFGATTGTAGPER
jgi:hypothetical protein